MSMSDRFHTGYLVCDAPMNERMRFIRRTYLHLTGAIGAFVLLSTAFQMLGLGGMMLQWIAGGKFNWLLFMGGFMVLSWLATSMAHSDSNSTTPYGGLALYTLAYAFLFSPMLTLAAWLSPSILPSAAVITMGTFGALTAFVYFTKADFSFLRTALYAGGIIALLAIVASAIFGFHLGIWFTVAMLIFSCGSILYTTSQVMRTYHTHQHVGAAVELFGAVAMLFWYVLRLLTSLSRD